MSNITNIEDMKIKRTIGELKKTYSEITGYNEKHEEALKEQDGFYRLAKRIANITESEKLTWNVSDGDINIIMGTEKVWMFDSDLIIISAYGGGLESILWLRNDIGIDDIYKWLTESYEGFKFIDFVEV